MAYENVALTELMKQLKQQKQTDNASAETFLWDDTPETDAEDPIIDEWMFPQEEPEIDIAECVRTALQALEPYHLNEDEQQIIREFLTFRLQTERCKYDLAEVRRTYYNLILVCEEPDAALRVSEILSKALDIEPSAITQHTEQSAIERCDAPSRNTVSRRSFIPERTRMLIIYDCREAPRINMDNGSSARDKNRKELENYQNMWQTVFDHIRKNSDVILIVSGSNDVYRSSLRPNNELSQRICRHHIHLRSRTPEELLQDCLSELRGSSFTLADGFEEALSDYFPTACRVSDLSGQAFIDDLINQIYARYFCRQRHDLLLTPDCLPGDAVRFQSAEQILGQMNELVGLQSAKEEFQNIYKMQLAGLAEKSTRYHMLFTGNPGTGKTTVARMAADLFFRMNIIKTNRLVIAKPADLVSEWIGGTGNKAMEVIRRAYNGVLFIDEAYGIATMDRGRELLNLLVQEMENNSDKLVVIIAGYTDEMRQLMQANPGLASRIGREIRFDDYTPEELAQIFLRMCKKDGFALHPSARDELEDCIGALMTREFFGNAREIRNLLQDLKEVWSDEYYNAVTKHGAENVHLEKVFCPRHFEKLMPPKKEVSINDLIGLETLKSKLATFKNQATYQKFLREKGFTNLSDFSLHMIFTGNPGTGKTTVAKLIADDLYSIGMLKTNRLVVAERKDLVSAYGDTAKKTADMIRKAVGGVLFVDEAYSLADSRRSGLGNECIEVLLTAMEEHKSDTVFIFAGYVEEMQEFLAMNPGIRSRIGYTFHFDDYSPAELTQMYADKMQKTGFTVSVGAMEKVRQIMEYFQDVNHFGNGRFVDHVIHQTISQRANRDFTKQYRSIRSQDIPSIKTLIETAPNNMNLYDPAAITPQELRRTALHELGHAAVMVSSVPASIPKSISIHSHAGSLGRVKLTMASGNPTEQELLNHIATLLGGKNAEKAFFGSHSTGCGNDYARAKRVAEDMIEQFAMTSFGTTAAQILNAADKLSMDIILQHKDRLESIADTLLRQKELTGEAFAKALSE